MIAWGFGSWAGNAPGQQQQPFVLQNVTFGLPPAPEPPKPLPKAFVAGPTLAYRLYRVRRFKDGLRLGAVASDAWIPPGEPRPAICHNGNPVYGSLGTINFDPSHMAPAQGCSCGWYGVNDVSKVVGYEASPDDVMLLAAQIGMWGRVIEHEHGYRAQYAYPVRLWRREPAVPLPAGFPKPRALDDALREVAAAYGCEVGPPR